MATRAERKAKRDARKSARRGTTPPSSALGPVFTKPGEKVSTPDLGPVFTKPGEKVSGGTSGGGGSTSSGGRTSSRTGTTPLPSTSQTSQKATQEAAAKAERDRKIQEDFKKQSDLRQRKINLENQRRLEVERLRINLERQRIISRGGKTSSKDFKNKSGDTVRVETVEIDKIEKGKKTKSRVVTTTNLRTGEVTTKTFDYDKKTGKVRQTGGLSSQGYTKENLQEIQDSLPKGDELLIDSQGQPRGIRSSTLRQSIPFTEKGIEFYNTQIAKRFQEYTPLTFGQKALKKAQAKTQVTLTELKPLQQARRKEMNVIANWRTTELNKIKNLTGKELREARNKIEQEARRRTQLVKSKYDKRIIQLSGKLGEEKLGELGAKGVVTLENVQDFIVKFSKDKETRKQVFNIAKEIPKVVFKSGVVIGEAISGDKEAKAKIKTISNATKTFIKTEVDSFGVLLRESPTEAILVVGEELLKLYLIGKVFKIAGKLSANTIKGTARVGGKLIPKSKLLTGFVKVVGTPVRFVSRKGSNVLRFSRATAKQVLVSTKKGIQKVVKQVFRKTREFEGAFKKTISQIEKQIGEKLTAQEKLFIKNKLSLAVKKQTLKNEILREMRKALLGARQTTRVSKILGSVKKQISKEVKRLKPGTKKGLLGKAEKVKKIKITKLAKAKLQRAKINRLSREILSEARTTKVSKSTIKGLLEKRLNIKISQKEMDLAIKRLRLITGKEISKFDLLVKNLKTGKVKRLSQLTKTEKNFINQNIRKVIKKSKVKKVFQLTKAEKKRISSRAGERRKKVKEALKIKAKKELKEKIKKKIKKKIPKRLKKIIEKRRLKKKVPKKLRRLIEKKKLEKERIKKAIKERSQREIKKISKTGLKIKKVPTKKLPKKLKKLIEKRRLRKERIKRAIAERGKGKEVGIKLKVKKVPTKKLPKKLKRLIEKKESKKTRIQRAIAERSQREIKQLSDIKFKVNANELIRKARVSKKLMQNEKAIADIIKKNMKNVKIQSTVKARNEVRKKVMKLVERIRPYFIVDGSKVSTKQVFKKMKTSTQFNSFIENKIIPSLESKAKKGINRFETKLTGSGSQQLVQVQKVVKQSSNIAKQRIRKQQLKLLFKSPPKLKPQIRVLSKNFQKMKVITKSASLSSNKINQLILGAIALYKIQSLSLRDKSLIDSQIKGLIKLSDVTKIDSKIASDVLDKIKIAFDVLDKIKSGTRLRTVTEQVPEKIKEIVIPIIKKKHKTKILSKAVDTFYVVLRKRGKQVRIRTPPLTLVDGRDVLGYVIDRKLQRTAKLVPIGRNKTVMVLPSAIKGYFTKNKKKFRGFQIKKGKKKTLTRTYIENKKYVGDLPSEQRELQAEKRRKPTKKLKKKKTIKKVTKKGNSKLKKKPLKKKTRKVKKKSRKKKKK